MKFDPASPAPRDPSALLTLAKADARSGVGRTLLPTPALVEAASAFDRASVLSVELHEEPGDGWVATVSAEGTERGSVVSVTTGATPADGEASAWLEARFLLSGVLRLLGKPGDPNLLVLHGATIPLDPEVLAAARNKFPPPTGPEPIARCRAELDATLAAAFPSGFTLRALDDAPDHVVGRLLAVSCRAALLGIAMHPE